ncbi:hypothetical protein JCM8097_008102 [Rhodosporidiobolus ruineniae]
MRSSASTEPFSPPLRLSPSPTLPSSSSSFAPPLAASTPSTPLTASVPPSPHQAATATASAVLTRRTGASASATPTTSRTGSPLPFNDNSDVTRPTLRRVANDVLGATAATTGGGLTPLAREEDEDEDGYVVRKQDRKGKGRAVEVDGRRAVSEGQAGGCGKEGKEREVIVHKLAKTDTIASVSLQYGITPQALRSSNRLWPSDPIHLRSTLLIPLDQCNLPSSSFGVERIAREENGDLTVWQRSQASVGASGSVQANGGLGGAAERAGQEDGLLSPRARRLASASAFELGGSDGTSTPPIPPSEFLDVWSDSPSSSRPSLDVDHPALAPSAAVSAYLATTNNTFSASPSPPPPTDEELVFRTVSPPNRSSSAATASNGFSRPSSSAATSPPPGAGVDDSTAPAKPLEKRTLRVERMPASQLAFFPPAADSSSSSSAADKPSTSSSSTHSTATNVRRKPEDDSLFFGPLTNSLSSSFSALGLDRYLPSSLSASSSSGSIALPPSPGATRKRPPATVGGALRSKWSLLNFGAEESEAALGGGAGGAGYFAAAAGGFFGTSGGRGGGGGQGGLGLGLTDTGTWSSRRASSSSSSHPSSASAARPSAASVFAQSKPLPRPPPSPRQPPSPSGSPTQQQQRHPRRAKLRDSNEGVYGAGLLE